MDGSDEAVMQWQLKGSLRGLPLSIDGTSRLRLNLLSGQVLEQRESWSLAGSSPQAAAAFWSTRLIWSLAQGIQDLQEAELPSLGPFGDKRDDNRSPMGPMSAEEYFGGGDETSQQNENIILFTGVLLIIWLSVKFYGDLFVDQ